MRFLDDVPVLAVAVIAMAFAMAIPASYALVLSDLPQALIFLTSGLLMASIGIGVLIVTRGRVVFKDGPSVLLVLLLIYLVIPAICAVPVYRTGPFLTFGQAYFEMLSCLTTTGATVFDSPDATTPSVHLWRSLVAWFGGGLTLVAGAAVLQPLTLANARQTVSLARPDQQGILQPHKRTDLSIRIIKSARLVLPIYIIATAMLGFILVTAGDRLFVAMTHAMGVLSTSGISGVGGLEQSHSGRWGEVVIVVFLCFAISHHLYSVRSANGLVRVAKRSREFRFALWVCAVLTILLFMRHYIGAFEVEAEDNLASALRSLWGTVFTILSFLTTMGFESQDWTDAQNWSGLPNSSFILLFLAIIGGGVATTAGGVKLLRAIVLFDHGRREVDRLVHPSSVTSFVGKNRIVAREGAYIAWMSVMILLLSLGIGASLLAVFGHNFETAFVLSAASISNVGPLAGTFGDSVLGYGLLEGESHMVLGALMVLGRMEVLAVIALLNPEYWRR